MQQKILEIKNLSKSYGEITALANFSLDLEKGEVLGLLGPNGAGKTTLISILSGTLRDFTGTVAFKGQDLFGDRRLRNLIGIVPQEMAFYEDLGALENLMFWGGLYDIPEKELKKRALELLALVELGGRAKEPIKKFSGGMKRRLNIAIGLIHRPELLLLDEPTVGIDVQAKVSILDIIRDVGRQGTSVVFTTHQLSEVEQTCSRIAIMDKGAILAAGHAGRAGAHRRREGDRRGERRVQRRRLFGDHQASRTATAWRSCRSPTTRPTWPSPTPSASRP